ncbi:MAG: chloride channel protein [Bacteroidetes bacterium]|nr:chloride channel protein [Bacteroidota bacterium]
MCSCFEEWGKFDSEFDLSDFNSSAFTFPAFVFPALGIFLTVLFAQAFLGGHLGRGVANIIYTISRKASRVERDKLYSQMVSSILTVGFGGSAGLEAPIASTGSAIGSHAARWLRFNEKERTLLLACGAAASISAIFNAPIAGVILLSKYY